MLRKLGKVRQCEIRPEEEEDNDRFTLDLTDRLLNEE